PAILAVVDHLMLPGVVPEHVLTFPPGIDLVLDAELGRVLLRHDQAQMVAQVAPVWTLMGGYRLARVEDRETRLERPVDPVEGGAGPRAVTPVGLGLLADQV